MPSTEMKVKSGNKYSVKYRVAGALSQLSREDVEALAVRYLRSTARNNVLASLNEAEPAIVTNTKMRDAMVNSGICDLEKATAFFSDQGLVLEIPTVFEIPLTELIPGESSRGKKAADIFSFEDVEDDTEGEASNG